MSTYTHVQHDTHIAPGTLRTSCGLSSPMVQSVSPAFFVSFFCSFLRFLSSLRFLASVRSCAACVALGDGGRFSGSEGAEAWVS